MAMRIIIWLSLHLGELQLIVSVLDVVLSLIELFLSIGYLPMMF